MPCDLPTAGRRNPVAAPLAGDHWHLADGTELHVLKTTCVWIVVTLRYPTGQRVEGEEQPRSLWPALLHGAVLLATAERP